VATYRQGAPVPEAIDRFLVTGLQPEKDDRFQSAEDFLEALHAALAGAGDVVLDAVPRRTDEGAQEGAGSSSASRKGSQASRSGKIVTRSASAVGRQSARGQSSRVVVEEPPRSALPLIAGALALVVLGVGGAIAWKVGHPPEPPPEVTTPRAAVAPPEPTTTTPTPAHITLKTTPGGAEIAEDGVVLGTTPVTLDWAKDQRRTLTITLAGYKPLEKTLKPSADQEFEFALEASTPRPAVTHPVKPGPRKPDDGVSAFE
jgi:serine/threonine-protein kinase